jgi:hypothetical protein
VGRSLPAGYSLRAMPSKKAWLPAASGMLWPGCAQLTKPSVMGGPQRF